MTSVKRVNAPDEHTYALDHDKRNPLRKIVVKASLFLSCHLNDPKLQI
jgi:hypothetical protein